MGIDDAREEGIEEEYSADLQDSKYIHVTQDNIPKILDMFHEDLPDEAIIEQSKFGMTFTGYRIGWTIDRLNQIIGPHQWNMIVTKESVSTTEKGAFRATMSVMLAIGPPKAYDGNEPDMWYNEEPWNRLTVVPVLSKEAYGDSINPSKGDALKGAFSDAAKKALSMIGIGVKAYKGLISDVEDDIGYVDVKPDSGKDTLPW